MNTTAIREAAEAVERVERCPLGVIKQCLEYGDIEWIVQDHHGGDYADCGEYKSVATLIALLDPATVKELCDAADENKWISVKDRLPDTIGAVLVFRRASYEMAWSFFNSKERFARCGPECGFYDDVTHWMPLPNPPEAEE